MVPVSTTSEFLLADARAALRRRVADAGRTELSRAFAACLLDDTDTGGELVALVRNAATREGALQDFPTVAILGFGADAGISGPEQIEALKRGLRRHRSRGRDRWIAGGVLFRSRGYPWRSPGNEGCSGDGTHTSGFEVDVQIPEE